MAQNTYDEVNLMLRLYDMRREARLRQARAWFVEHFHPESPEEMMQKYPQGSEENTYIRMVISYWDMVAGIVNRGLIDDELFFESNGEIWVCGTACVRSSPPGAPLSRIPTSSRTLRMPASASKRGVRSARRDPVRRCAR